MKTRMFSIIGFIVVSVLASACDQASSTAEKVVTSQSSPGSSSSQGGGGVSNTNSSPVPISLPATRPTPPPITIEPIPSYGEGMMLGIQNARTLFDRLKKKTVELNGCADVVKLEKALVQVSKSIQAPKSNDTKFVHGFFDGYMDVIKKSILETRKKCDATTMQSGHDMGELYGSVLCQLSTVSIDVAKNITMSPVYDGWSGSSDLVLEECTTTMSKTLKTCSVGDVLLDRELDVQIHSSCTDKSVHIGG